MKKFKHVILINFEMVFLEKEIELFNKYLLPSIKGQKNKNFDLIILIDKKIDIDYEGTKFFTIDQYKKYRGDLKKEYEYIIETLAEKEGIISPEFIKKIQLKFIESNLLIEFRGYKYDETNNQIYKDALYNKINTSPFISLISPLSEDFCILNYNQNNICDNFRIFFGDGLEWIQIINKENPKSFRGKGRRCNKPEWFNNLKK